MAVSLRVVEVVDPLDGPKPFCLPSGLSVPYDDSQPAREEAWDRSVQIFQKYEIFLVATQFIIPLVIISFSYITIALHLWGSQGPGEQNQQNLVRTKQRQKVSFSGCDGMFTWVYVYLVRVIPVAWRGNRLRFETFQMIALFYRHSWSV